MGIPAWADLAEAVVLLPDGSVRLVDDLITASMAALEAEMVILIPI